jgi:hypothetical protein
MKPHLVIVSDRSLTAGDGRMRRSARLYAELATAFKILAIVRTSRAEAMGDAVLAPDFVERRITRTAAEVEWLNIAIGRYGPHGGDDALAFDRVRALNPPFMSAVTEAARSAAAVVCLRPYAYATIRAGYGGPVVYDALELEYTARAAKGLKAANAVDYLETLAALEERCAREAALVLCGSPIDALLIEQMYGVDSGRIVTAAPAFDANVAAPFTDAERSLRKPALSASGHSVALFVGSAKPDNVRDALAVCAVAKALPDVIFFIAGSLVDVLPPCAPPANVHFTGLVDDATLTLLLETADVFVAPGSARSQPAAKLLDAVAHGAPLVLTPETAAGVFSDHADADVAPLAEFPSRIRALLNSPERRERQARAAQQTALRSRSIARTAAPLRTLLEAFAPNTTPS